MVKGADYASTCSLITLLVSYPHQHIFSFSFRISVRNGDDNVEFASIDSGDVSKLAISPDAKYICTFAPFRSGSSAYILYYL